MNSNMYIIIEGRKAVVFDPCEDIEAISLFNKKNVEKLTILLTHEHHDHVTGVNMLKKNNNCDVICQKKCCEALFRGWRRAPALTAMVLLQKDREDGGHRYRDFMEGFVPFNIIANITFERETFFSIGELPFRAVSTPGHSPGSSCYMLFDKIVFTGDSLLQNEQVIIRFKDSNADEYKKVTLPFLCSLPSDTIIMPGHGDPFILKDTKNI